MTNVIYENTYLYKIQLYSKNVCIIVFNVSSVYLLWILIHFISVHLYVYFCVPSTYIGFLYSPFLISTPHCKALRWATQTGASTIDNMWIVFGTWICSIIVKPFIE